MRSLSKNLSLTLYIHAQKDGFSPPPPPSTQDDDVFEGSLLSIVVCGVIIHRT